MDDYDNVEESEPSADPKQHEADQLLRAIFTDNPADVFYSRQLEVMLEKRCFHWITHRALRDLVAEGFVRKEIRELATGTNIHLFWLASNRYYKRRAKQVVALVNEYARPTVVREIGARGEELTLEAFARNQFLQRGRNTRTYGGRTYTATRHDLDFIFERDGVAYGVEVKNTLPYMEREDFDVAVAICAHLRIRPVHVVRRNPETWLLELRRAGGFTLMLDWQLYPTLLADLAKRVRTELRLPVDSPRALQEGTMRRLMNWHETVRPT